MIDLKAPRVAKSQLLVHALQHLACEDLATDRSTWSKFIENPRRDLVFSEYLELQVTSETKLSAQVPPRRSEADSLVSRSVAPCNMRLGFACTRTDETESRHGSSLLDRKL